MFSRIFFPLITRPTRITSHKASLIDNIFTNEPLNQPISGLFMYDISDHLPIFAIMPGYVQTSYNNKYFTFRDKNPENLARFKSEIETVNWAGLPDFNNPSRAYGAFLKKYKQIFNRCFPLKKVKAKNVSLKKPWFSKALLKSVRKKNILYKRFLNNPTSRSEFLYKCYKNKLNHTIRVAKRLYYGKKIEEAKSNIKNTWRLLNEILNRKSKKQLLPSIFNIGEQELSDPTQIAEQFCKYFTNIGPSLASNIPVSQKSPHSFLSGNFVNSLFFEEVSEQEIVNICCSLRSGSTTGYDNISMSLIKDTITSISNPLTHIFNLSITSGIVPVELKIARVVPLFKAGDKSLFVNYRPISILPSFSKILEKIVYSRLMNYLNKYKILSDNQFGFRKNHSTELALTLLYDKISSAIDNNMITVGIFIDLSKPFDTVNQILLDKLQYYGVRGVAHDWFSNYLQNRQQFVQYNGTNSSYHNIKCGVPQGSILGPLLFLIYVNDLCNVSKALDFILFADDTNIFFSHKNLNILEKTLNEELPKLTDWCLANKLSINYKKSNFMIFKSKQKRQTFDINLKINDCAIGCVKETVFLGVVLDENLSWKPHITNVARKISKSIGIIYKASFCLPTSSLCTLYYSLVYPYLIYCISVWGSTYSSNLNRIFLLQKKVIRIMSRSSYLAHTDPLFKQLKILKLHNLYLFQVGKFMFLFKKGLLPDVFNDMFLLTNQVHSYNTRNSNAFYRFSCRTNMRQFAIRFQGPKFFNTLNRELQNSDKLFRFKTKLKEFLLL